MRFNIAYVQQFLFPGWPWLWRSVLVFLGVTLSWGLTGCVIDGYQPSLIDYTYPATDRLLYNLGHGSIEPHIKPLRIDQPLLVASFVELDNIEKTSTFGRLVAEQMASRLNQNGFTFIEVKLRSNLYVRAHPGGELALSRDLQAIGRQHEAQGFLVGTYSQVQDFVYVSARILRVDGHVYASHDFAIPRSRLVESGIQGRYDAWQNLGR
ncbi:MAG: hypothetical protein HQL73_00245 [Magnetococcales bacterium]|nr:hypothetical protein [Magnetococcales bacterium]